MKEIIIAGISALVGGAVTFMFERVGERRREKKEKLQRLEENRRNRPEFNITEMKDFFDQPGMNTREKTCDLEVCIVPIDGTEINGEEVVAQYDKTILDRNSWVCREYTIKNVGKTAVYEVDIISNFKRKTCIFDVEMVNERMLEFGALNYHELYDRRVGPEESFTLKLCYNKDKISSGFVSAVFELGMRDDNGVYWIQPFFAPDDKLYKSRSVSYKDYREEIMPDIAIECFKKPYMW